MRLKRRSGARTSAVTLIACLAGGLTACAPDPIELTDDAASITVPRDRDPVMARVEGTEIYASDVQRAAAAQGLIGDNETLMPDDPVFTVTISDLIDQRLLALDAMRQDIAELEEAKRRLAAARERILGNLRVEQHLAERVNDDTIRALYEAQRSLSGQGEERRARQIVVEDEATALTVLERLNDEEDFEALVTEFSIDEATRAQGGDLGWVNRNMLAAPLRGPVFGTNVGARSAPVQSPLGWHIIEVLDRRVPNQRSFEDTREDIARFMTFEAIENLMTDLRDRAEIERIYETLPDEARSEMNEERAEP